MSIEKMREEFEVWYAAAASKATGMVMSASDVKDKRGESGDYAKYGYMHGCWIGWQASRAAIEVELPDDGIEDCQDAWGDRCKNTFDCGYNFASLRHEQAMQAAGLKVKA